MKIRENDLKKTTKIIFHIPRAKRKKESIFFFTFFIHLFWYAYACCKKVNGGKIFIRIIYIYIRDITITWQSWKVRPVSYTHTCWVWLCVRVNNMYNSRRKISKLFIVNAKSIEDSTRVLWCTTFTIKDQKRSFFPLILFRNMCASREFCI